MKAFTIETGIVVPLNRSNVDTDAILPKQFLKSIKRSGFGVSLFEEWRYLDAWHVDIDYTRRLLNNEFVFNFPHYQGASVLLARANFGCGSSREHAVWALDDYGIRSVIAPSFGDIFFNNCFKNGILPIVLPETQVDELFETLAHYEQAQTEKYFQGLTVTIDLEKQQVSMADKVYGFEIDPFRKDCLLQGLDEIGLTLQHADKIRAFEASYSKQCPWVFENTQI